MFQDRFW